ncbi:MAG TPA: hypothetical protein VNH11_10200, partial [Pirellulales bacterium]|nr:hypothetical protein [Pirellulales bacterium]
ARAGKQVADMLFKVWLKDGGECWLFIHVEIQGFYEKEFSRRMFDDNTSAYKLYHREVVSLAVLCDERASWRPTAFGYGPRAQRTRRRAGTPLRSWCSLWLNAGSRSPVIIAWGSIALKT